MEINRILERWASAKTKRSNWEGTWEECYDYTMPGREGFSSRSPGIRNDDLIFDETAVVGVQEFSSRMIQGIVPSNVRWVRLEPAPAMRNGLTDTQLQETQAQLDEVTAYAFEIIEGSNFQQEAHEAFLDVAVGTGNLVIEEGDAVNPIKFHAVPLHQVALESGPFDRVDAQYRERPVKISDVKIIWPKAKLGPALLKMAQEKPNEEITLLECTMRDWTKVIETYDYILLHEKTKETIYTTQWTGSGSCPWVNFRWSKMPNEVYGRGPVFNSLAAIKTANLTVQLILENAEMSIAGVWQADDDGIVNPHNINLRPGTIIPRAVNSRGLEPLKAPGNFDVSQLILQDMRHNINKALYNETLGRREGTPISATEVAERMGDLSRTLGATFGRLQSEFVFPTFKRVIHILKKQGRIELPAINGTEIKIRAVSPMVRAQRNEDITQHINFATIVGQMFGPQMVQTIINPTKFSQQLAEWYEINLNTLRTEEEQKELAQQMGEQMANAQAQGIDPTEAIRKMLP